MDIQSARADPIKGQNCIEKHSTSIANPVATATITLAVCGFLAGILVVQSNPIAACFIAAILCGWSEVDGACGMSHVGSLTPLRNSKAIRFLWIRSVSAYTFWGVISSAFVGAMAGSLRGLASSVGLSTAVLLSIVSLTAVVLIMREIGLVNLRLPQFRCQTQKMWSFKFGSITAAGMWGAHIGLGVATVIKHGGFYIIFALAVVMGPTFGALLLATYWIGRTLPMWFGPTMKYFVRDNQKLPVLIASAGMACRLIATSGLILASIATLMMITRFDSIG